MTKKSILTVSKFLLALLLVTGAMNVTASNALAQEVSSDEVVNSQLETTEYEVTEEDTTPVVTTNEVVEETQEDEFETAAPFAVSAEVEAAQQAALAKLPGMLADATAIVNALPNLSSEEKAASIAKITQALDIESRMAYRVTIEEVDALMATTTSDVEDYVNKAIALDSLYATIASAKEEMASKVADVLAQIDTLEWLSETQIERAKNDVQTAHDNFLRWLDYNNTEALVQEDVDKLVDRLDSILESALFNDKIAEINTKLDEGRDIINNNDNLTSDEKREMLDAINAIVDSANDQLSAATTIDEKYAILSATIVELEKFIGDMMIDLAPDPVVPPVDAPVAPPVDAPVAPPVDAPVDVPVLTPVPDESVTDVTTLPNTGLDNSSLFLSVTALMVGALTLVLALKRNRNV